MFRWCSYCQHLIGEAEPLENYGISHGLCVDCEAAMERGDMVRIEPGVLKARDHFVRLMKAGLSGDADKVSSFVQEASRDGLRSSDILVGLIQPALYRIGRQWQTGKVTVADEHRFTDFCVKIYERLPESPKVTGATTILLALTPDNRHDVGVNILRHLAEERGLRCVVLPTGTPASGIVAAVLREKPALFGLSLSTVSSLTDAKELLALCARAAPGLRMTVGGLAMRTLPADFFPGVRGARLIDDFQAEIDALAKPA